VNGNTNENGRAREYGASAGLLEKAVECDFDVNENTVPSDVETPSKHDPSALDAHEAAGHELIALDGKRPLARGWTSASALSLEAAKARMAAGRNVGVRLRDTDLVIDVDPRHFDGNDDPLARLVIDFGLPDAPFVVTGGGGKHLYFRKPAGVEITGKLAGYAGIDFKSRGGQVVAAGSIHPNTARSYVLDDDVLRIELAEAPEATTALLEAIGKRSVAEVSGGGAIDEERLAEWLGIIDVADFKDELKWRELMMACHHATNGAGVDAFIDWSTSDHDYADHGDIIRRRWNSLNVKPGAITARTLIAALPKEMRREATELLGRAAPEDDFEDDLHDEPGTSRSVWDEWVFVADAMQFVRREDGRKYRTDQWKALHAGLYPDGDILNAVWRDRVPVRKFERLIYLPGKPELPWGTSNISYNIWRKSGVAARLGDVKPFLDHMTFLFPHEGDRELVLDYLALLVQKPADKIRFALLVRGAQGTGKSWIGNLMERIIGAPNVVRPSNDEVVSRWTAWMEGAQLAIVEELMTLGRLEVANRLKPIITDPTIRIEEKNCSIYSIPNHLNFLCFTNHDDALKIEHGDRRWLVVFSPAVKKEAGYYDRLFGYLEDGGAAFVKQWLLQRQIVLNGQGVAPPTSGKETMRRMSMGDAEAYLLDLYEGREPPFDFDLVRVDDLVQAVPAKLSGKSNLCSRLSKFLKEELGAVAHTRHTKQHASRPPWQLWSLRNHDIWQNIGASGRIDAYVNHYAIDVTPPSSRNW
jgi:hypothetical protein